MSAIWQGWKRLGLSGQILVGLGLGVLLGLFLGEPAAVLSPAADIYIRLMQMTVLPYLITALVTAFGQLEMGQAKRLAVRGGALLLLIWAVMIVVLWAIPKAFPDFVNATFFSDSITEPAQAFSIAEIYFTSNPFESLSQNVVPAVVLFSCLMGVALIGLKDKARLLDPLRVWNEAIVGITHMVIGLTPYGVFAIGAVTAGTMDAETFIRLEAYFVAFAAAAVLLAFVILPMLVTAVTPFRYREVAGIARDALITAFVAHNAFIVLPILIERSKELLERHGLLDEQTDSAADVIIPVLFNFPNAGKLLTLLFIPFVAWLGGTPLAGGDYSSLFTAGIPAYFAKAQIALPFLLDLFGLPADLFRLYIPTTIITGKFDSMLTAMNLLVFALLGAGAMGGFLVFDKARLLRAGAVIAGSLLATVVLVRILLAATIDTEYRMDEALLEMHSPRGEAPALVLDEPPVPAADDGRSVFDRVRERGTLRVGFDPQNLPFSFFNANGQLVGFDVALAKRLAATLGLEPEFVPIDWSELPAMLADGRVDVMPGMWYRPNWFGQVRLTHPYMNGTMALAVRDERRHDFANVDELRQSSGLTIGIPLDRRQVQYAIERYFDGSDTKYEVIEFWKPFFEGEHPEIDAFLMPAEHASAWSLIHPEYTAVVPQPDPITLATAFAVPLAAGELQEAVNEWIVFARDTGEIDRAYTYWVLGKGAEDKTPRWSIMRDVLGWVD